MALITYIKVHNLESFLAAPAHQILGRNAFALWQQLDAEPEVKEEEAG